MREWTVEAVVQWVVASIQRCRPTTQIKLTPRAALLLDGGIASHVDFELGLHLLANLVCDGGGVSAERHLWLLGFTWRSLFAGVSLPVQLQPSSLYHQNICAKIV